jgi:hypothetical protein
MPLTRLLERLSERFPRVRVKQGHLLLAWIALFTLAGAVGFAVVLDLVQENKRLISENRQLGQQGKEAHDSLCVFRLELNERVTRTEDYIADVKAKRRKIIEGFTVAELERTLTSQKAAVNSLRTLDCPKEKP